MYLRDAPITAGPSASAGTAPSVLVRAAGGVDAPVLTVAEFLTGAGRQLGRPTKASAAVQGAPAARRGTVIGDLLRAQLEPRRLRQILDQAFAPTDPATDPPNSRRRRITIDRRWRICLRF